MNGITVYQPWAASLVSGQKRIETRGRPTKIRGRIFIHAAKKHPFLIPGFLETAAVLGLTSVKELTLGAIVGTVELEDCVPVESIINQITERERMLGEYYPGWFAWIVKNPVMFTEPIPAVGRQGWWKWDGV